MTAVLDVPLTDAVNCCSVSTATSAVVGETLTEIAGKTVTTEVPDLVESATDFPVTVTCAGLGTTAGAVYRPLDEMVPQLTPEQPTPDTPQLTAVFVVPVTVAANCCVCPTTICAVVGERWTTTGGRIVTATEADFVISALEVAVTVTDAGFGTAAGAV